MRKIHVKCHYDQKPKYKNSYTTYVDYPNIINGDFKCSKFAEKWFSDITYIPTSSGFLYLSAIIDGYTKKIVSYSLSTKIDSKLVLDTIQKAKIKFPNARPLIQNDLGSVYTSFKYIQTLKEFSYIQSFSKPGCPTDNAPIENFFSYFKRENNYFKTISKDIQTIKNKIIQYIHFYNNKRIHSKLGYLTPNKFFKQKCS